MIKFSKNEQETRNLLQLRVDEGKNLLKKEVLRESESRDLYFPNPQRTKYCEAEAKKFIQEVKKWDSYNCTLLELLCSGRENEIVSCYAPPSIVLSSFDYIEDVDNERDKLSKKILCLEDIIDRLHLLYEMQCKDSSFSVYDKHQNHEGNTHAVFVVHGHNDNILKDVCLNIRKLGLEPIVLREKEDAGRTIIQKFRDVAASARFAVIILSADDMAISKRDYEKKRTDEVFHALTPRARQNVILEMGYFIASLGPERVMMLVEDGIECPGDLAGIVYNKYEKGSLNWVLKLVQELRLCNYSVSADSLI